MWIIPAKSAVGAAVRWFHPIFQAVETSRFRAAIDIEMPATWAGPPRDGLHLRTVRLRRKKDYCGGHPGPCIVNPFKGEQPHKTTHYLEGSDWIGFNNLLNDVLDKLRAEADVYSFNRESFCRRYYIRRGRCRRLHYPHDVVTSTTFPVSFAHWTQGSFETDFGDFCGRRPPPIASMKFDRDTPGLASYRPRDEKRFFAQHEEVA